jgi:hypothetical protein
MIDFLNAVAVAEGNNETLFSFQTMFMLLSLSYCFLLLVLTINNCYCGRAQDGWLPAMFEYSDFRKCQYCLVNGTDIFLEAPKQPTPGVWYVINLIVFVGFG